MPHKYAESYYESHREEIKKKYERVSDRVAYRCRDCSAKITTGDMARKHVGLLGHVVELYNNNKTQHV